MGIILEKYFTADQIVHLKEFWNYLKNENADIVIFMARKAVRLYDLLSKTFGEIHKSEIVSDRILGFDPSYFKKKTVLVVDDTLILGTSLNKVKRYLFENNIKHKIAVFYIDKNNWKPWLINPDFRIDKITSDKVLNFSQSEVIAFASELIPYLVDFPISQRVNISIKDFSDLLDIPSWDPIEIPTESQINRTKNYTLILNKEFKKRYLDLFNEINNIFEVIKVRIFTRYKKNSIDLRFIPLVLLKPLKKESIKLLFDTIIASLPDKRIYSKMIKKSEARLRFIQYYFSYVLGQQIIKLFQIKIPEFKTVEFKTTELINVIGKFLGKNFEYSLNKGLLPSFKGIRINTEIELINDDDDLDKIINTISTYKFNLYYYFPKIFNNLFLEREIKARKNLKNIGDINSQSMKRLDRGITFATIMNYLKKVIEFSDEDIAKDYLSIGLDYSNDLGVSIPIIQKFDKELYYRTYRHGELARRTETNDILFFKFLNSIQTETKKDCFFRVELEKLTVLFYRIGIEHRFVDEILRYDDKKKINFSFYLYGSICSVSNGKNDFFPESGENWLLKTYVNEGKYLYIGEKNKYKLINEKIESEALPRYTKRNNEVQIVADLFSALFKIKKLDMRNFLTILSSCNNLDNLAMSIAAEANIINNWIYYIKIKHKSIFNPLSSNFIFKDLKQEVFNSFWEALNKLEYSLSTKSGITNIINKIEKSLKKKKKKSILNLWNKYIKNSLISNEHNEVEKIESKKIFSIINIIIEIGFYFFYIRALFELHSNITDKRIKCRSKFRLKRNYPEEAILEWMKIVEEESYVVNSITDFSIKSESVKKEFINKKEKDIITVGKYKGKIVYNIDNSKVKYKTIDNFYFFKKRIEDIKKDSIHLENYITIPEVYDKMKMELEKIKSDESFESILNFEKKISNLFQILQKKSETSRKIIDEITEEYEEQLRVKMEFYKNRLSGINVN